jgi:spore coat protein U-like protein
MTKTIIRSVLAASVAFAVSGSVFAAASEDGTTGANPSQSVTGGSITQDLNVSAVVNRYCKNLATTALAFSNFNPDDGVDQTTTFSVRCTTDTVATVSLDLGSNASGSQRRMADGSGNFLSYQLYKETGRSNVWSTGSGNTRSVTGTGLGSSGEQTLTVYGRVPAQDDAKPGVYTDIVQVTVEY